MAKEVAKAEKGGTTLTNAQNTHYQNVLKFWSTMPPGHNTETNAFFQELTTIQQLPPSERDPVLARLLYHGAHLKNGSAFLADVIGHCPAAETIAFTGSASRADTVVNALNKAADAVNPENPVDIYTLLTKKRELATNTQNAPLYDLNTPWTAEGIEELKGQVEEVRNRIKTMPSPQHQPNYILNTRPPNVRT